MECVAAKINLTIYEGGTFDKEYQWMTGATPAAVNLTGYTAKMTVRATLATTTAILSLTNQAGPWAADADTGIYLDTPTTGKYRIYIKDSDAAAICSTHANIDGVYDLFLISAGGESVLKQYGTARLIAAVTRA